MCQTIPHPLDEAIEVAFPKGYLYCENCGNYEHHPLVYCSECGHKYIRQKKMCWRDFIRSTAKHGSGPLLTFLDINGGFVVSSDPKSKFYVKFSDELKNVRKEAHEIWKEANQKK